MPFENFLDHACDIYHVVSTDETPGYNLPGSKKHVYLETPDIKDEPCHFAQGGSGGTVNTLVQNEPQHDYEDRIKLTLPLDTDIRVNDKIVDHRTGYIYYAEIPRTIRNHHKYVFVSREKPEAYI